MTLSNGSIFRVTGLLCGNSPVTGEIPAQKPVTRSFGVSMISAWTNSWASNGYAGDLRRHRAHYNVIVIWMKINQWISLKLLLWAPINNGPTFLEVSQPLLESMMTQFIDAYMCHKEHEFHFTICLSFSILDNFPIIYAKTLCPTSWNAFWKKNHCVLLKLFTWVPMNNESVFVDAMA